MSWKRWMGLFLLYFVVTVMLYSPSLGGPWQYDDYAQILDKRVLTVHTAAGFFGHILSFFPEASGRVTNRDFVRGLFRLNYDWFGDKTVSYRWVNLFIHSINGVLVFWLVLELLQVTSYKSQFTIQKEKYHPVFIIPLFTSLLFLIHPIQSQAVAYIAQRFTSVATMMFLLAIAAWIKAIANHKSEILNSKKRKVRWGWYGVSLFAALLAYSSKEIAVTLPVVLGMVAVFVESTRSAIGTKGIKSTLVRIFTFVLLIFPFFILSLKIPLQVLSSGIGKVQNVITHPNIAGETLGLKQTAKDLTRNDYFLTQLSVVATYLRLVVVPVGQNLDWDYPITRSINWQVILFASLHSVLIILGAVLFLWPRKRGDIQVAQPAKLSGKWYRANSRQLTANSLMLTANGGMAWKLVGLGILWFYITMLPESSVIPIIDVIYEHRVYLPFVGVLISISGLCVWLWDRFLRKASVNTWYSVVTFVSVWLLLLSAGTMWRAWVWGDDVRLWGDAVAKAPNKPRTNKNFGVVSAMHGNFEDGVKYLTKATEMMPENPDYWSNLGTAWLRQSRFDKSVVYFKKAFDIMVSTESYPGYETSAGLPFFATERLDAVSQYLNDYGVSLVRLQRPEEALTAFQMSIAYKPDMYSAWLGVGASYDALKNPDESIAAFEKAAQIDPTKPDAFQNLATVYAKVGRYTDALKSLLYVKQHGGSSPELDSKIDQLMRAAEKQGSK